MESLSNPDIKRLSLLNNRSFILLFIGKLVSQLGDVVYNMAIGWHILTITGSAAQMSIYMAIGTVVYIVMGPIGGVIADRINRKSIIIWMDIIRGGAVAVTGVLMYLEIESVYLFYLTSTILSICGALFVPASNAMMPAIVKEEQLTRANSIGGSIQSVSSIVGTVSGGVLYAVLGIKAIFILNAVSYVIAGILEIFIIVPRNEEDYIKSVSRKHVISELQESYKFIKDKRGLFKMMWFSTLINLILTPILAVFSPYIFNQILRVSSKQYSYVGAASAVGFILGAVILGLLPQREKISRYIKISLITFGFIIASMYLIIAGYSSNTISTFYSVILFILLYLLFGIANALLNIPTGTVIQKIVPNEILGKVSSLVNTLVMVAMPLGMLIGGAAADVLPMNMLLLGVAVMFTVVTFLICVDKDIREI